MNMGQVEQLYRLMFTNMKEGLAILSLDPADPDATPLIIDMNPAAVKLCRCRTFDFGNCRVTDCYPGWIDADRFNKVCHKLAGFGGSQDLGEVSRDGLFYRIRVFFLTERHIGLVISDCTRYREEEAQIAHLKEELEHEAATVEKRIAERTGRLEEINEELDAFAFSVSHDLRAPIRAMQAFAEILLEGEFQSPTERNAYLTRIKTAAQGMDRLIQDLLAYSRVSRQEITLESVDLDQVVRDAAQQLELAGGGKAYHLEISGDFPRVVGHHPVLVQVVLNLMTNGIKFVPKGVVPLLRVWAEESDEHCRLYIQDNGIGISPQHQERIFKIFERLHSVEQYPGTGVGLAIVRKAVQLLGGEIGMESREGEGIKFWVELRKSDDNGGRR